MTDCSLVHVAWHDAWCWERLASGRRVRAGSGWQIDEIVTGHDAMISAPRALLDSLVRKAAS